MKRRTQPYQVLPDLEPCVEMEEQPQPHSIRFRYASEGNSHGGLQGMSSQRGNKTYPTIVIKNHHGPVKVVVELVAKDMRKGIRPHAHELIGKGCENGVYSWKHMVDSPRCQIVFRHLSVQHVTKKTLVETLQRRLLMQKKDFRKDYEPTKSELDSVQAEAVELSKSLPMNSARLCFRVFLLDKHDQQKRQLDPAVSDAIFDAKSPSAALLKICRIDRHAGGCQGGDEVFLLCDRVQKGDIDVEFYEIGVDGDISWLEKATFTANDIHRQFAIVFTTPPYHDQNIEHQVDVNIRLYRPSDQEMSEPVKYTYRPNMEKDEIDRKRRKTLDFPFPDDTDDLSRSRGSGRSMKNELGLPSSFFQSPRDGNPVDSGVSRREQAAEDDDKLPSDVESDAVPTDDSYDADHDIVPDDSTPMNVEDHDPFAPDTTTKVHHQTRPESAERALLAYSMSGNVRNLLRSWSPHFSTTNEDGDSALGLAIIHGRTDAAINMIQTAVSLQPACLHHTNRLGQSLLHLCVMSKHDQMTRYLLSVRPQPGLGYMAHDLPMDAQDCFGNTFLHTAVCHKSYATVKALKSYVSFIRNRSPNADEFLDRLNDDGYSALHLAVRASDLDMLNLLYQLRPDLNVKDGRAGLTPLHQAVLMDDLSVAASLLSQAMVDVNVRCLAYQTSLHYACWLNRPAMASLLLAANADTRSSAPSLDDDDKPSNQGYTPHEIAMLKNYKELIEILNDGPLEVDDDTAMDEKIVKPGDIDRISYSLRHQMSVLFTKSTLAEHDDDWRALAEKLNLGQLVPYLEHVPDPTTALLDNYELEDGTVKQVYDAVWELKRYDVAYLLSKHLDQSLGRPMEGWFE